MIPAKQNPSKKRKVLNMGTLIEKATVRPNTSMNSTDMISTGWRPNLQSYNWKKLNKCINLLKNVTKCCCKETQSNLLPVSKDSKHQVSKDGSHQQRELCNMDFPCWVTHQTPLSRQINMSIISKEHTLAFLRKTHFYLLAIKHGI